MVSKLPKVQFKVGVTTGLWVGGQVPDTATIVRKLGYGLTRGTSVIEIALNVPNEITYNDGKELRYIAKSQGLELTLHGSLTIPMAIPERAEWRDAHNHITASIKSAVFGGCTYVNFHSCLNFWLEMMTYAGRKLSLTFCDHFGRFISDILKENEKLRKWFVKNRTDEYWRFILTEDEVRKVSVKVSMEAERWRRGELLKRLRNAGFSEKEIGDYIVYGRLPANAERRKKFESVLEKFSNDASAKRAEIEKKLFQEAIEKKLARGEKWRTEDLGAIIGVIDGYHILAHYLFYKKDPVWVEMVKMYENVVVEKYKLDYNDPEWLDKAWKRAEEKNDREFKEFFYAVCAAKFLEGHIIKAFEWIEKEFIPFLEKSNYKDKEELIEYAKNLRITIEPPDARDPRYGGLYLIFRPKQIYVAIKVLREVDKIDKVFMLIDFEHIATQGLDPLEEIQDFAKLAKDAGKFILSFHVTPPTPLHPHIPIEVGDREIIYRMLWELRKVGLGKYHTVYLIFERGGLRDPFKESVVALRVMKHFLEKDVPPDDLPPEFYGLPSSPDLARQRVIIFEHALDPLKGTLAIPEEHYTYLGKAVVGKGKRPEEWKKEELR